VLTMAENYSYDELKKKRKKELITIVGEMSKEMQVLTVENREQKNKIDSLMEEIKGLKEQVASQEVEWKNAGSLADYAAQVNDILVSTQKAADMYLNNIKRAQADKEQEAKIIVDNAQKKASAIMSKVQKEAEQIKTSSAIVLEHLKSNVDKSLQELEERFHTEEGD